MTGQVAYSESIYDHYFPCADKGDCDQKQGEIPEYDSPQSCGLDETKQIDGDCKELVCESGSVRTIPDSDDVPEDFPENCKIQKCVNGAPVTIYDDFDAPTLDTEGDCKQTICKNGQQSVVNFDGDPPHSVNSCVICENGLPKTISTDNTCDQLSLAEKGWFAGKPGSSNTVVCDGKGKLVVHNGTKYKHGMTECTIKHEEQHVKDLYNRYGKNVCKGRSYGDRPNYNVKGKDKWNDFVKKTECKAWKIGARCRKEKLKACSTVSCKNYVKKFVKQGDDMIKKFCGI